MHLWNKREWVSPNGRDPRKLRVNLHRNNVMCFYLKTCSIKQGLNLSFYLSKFTKPVSLFSESPLIFTMSVFQHILCSCNVTTDTRWISIAKKKLISPLSANEQRNQRREQTLINKILSINARGYSKTWNVPN